MRYANELMHAISDHGNAIVSKLIVWFGVGGMGYSGAIVVSEKVQQATKTVIESPPAQGLTASDVGITISIVSGICLIIKTLVDIYYKIKENREK